MRKISGTFKTAFLSCALALAISTAAQGFSVVHSFAGGSNDGANPYAGVIPLGKGDFAVTTDRGGSANLGTVTVIRKSGASQVFHSFTGGSDGQNADGTMADDGTLLYGTTTYGGAAGCGTFFALHHDGSQYGIIHSYTCADGAFPFSGLTWGYGPGLYATTVNGGSGDFGTISAPSEGDGTFYCSFAGSDGSQPYGGVTEVKLVNDYAYYIAASAGGSSNLGTVTEFDWQGCNVRVLHNFTGGSDGANPYGTLWYDGGFFLYGTTRFGGANGLGTVFKMDISGDNYTVLHTFQGICCGNSDGSFPFSGLTLNPKDGMLYGTTINGGGSSDNGTIYKIDPNSGAETVVHAFSGADGAHPYASLYVNPKGKVYGTTLQGGAHNLGAVFKLKT
jgi:uncharacterized repeat protein (TIGR03803 family)